MRCRGKRAPDDGRVTQFVGIVPEKAPTAEEFQAIIPRCVGRQIERMSQLAASHGKYDALVADAPEAASTAAASSTGDDAQDVAAADADWLARRRKAGVWRGEAAPR